MVEEGDPWGEGDEDLAELTHRLMGGEEAACCSSSDEVETFTDDEDEDQDTTAAQFQAGKDLQGIPWERLQFSREHYRKERLKLYNNYLNMKAEVESHQEQLAKESKPVQSGAQYFDFVRNSRAVRSTIVHFQLRNLVWPTSKHDVYVMHENCVLHWNNIRRKSTMVMDLAGGLDSGRPAGLGRVQVSTMAAGAGLVAAGGFNGELVVRSLARPGLACSLRVTASDNGITNGIEISETGAASARIMTSNNDNHVRVFDAASSACLQRFPYPWAVNWATACCDGSKAICVVGDDPEAILTDIASGKQIASLRGHLDYSFAAAWHPGGTLLATGNQDTTTRVWDVRQLGRALAVLPGRMGAMRSLRFSACGRFLAAAEPADFVHIYDVAADFARSQVVDLFGEIAGFGFSPDADNLYIGVADVTYSSLLHFQRAGSSRMFE